MNRSTSLAFILVACLPFGLLAAEDEELTDLSVKQPLYRAEKTSAVRLTRLAGVRLSWNETNRIVAARLHGTGATDHSVALAAQLLGLRTLSLVALPENHLTNAGLAPLASHPTLQSLRISGNRLNDRVLVHVQSIPTLEILLLNGNFTDAAVQTITVLPKLRHLDLTQCHITDAGLAYLTQLPHLETLVLNDTRISNAGLDAVAELKELAHLYVGDTALDDRAVAKLKNLVQLETLFIKRTNLSADGVAELIPALPPTCRIIHDGGTEQGQREPQTAMAQTAANQWDHAP